MASFTLKNFCQSITMSCKIINFASLKKTFLNQRLYSSALYIPGSKASKTFAFLTPEIDFDERFFNIKKLKKELDLRSIKIEVEELHKTWSYYQYILSNRKALEKQVTELTNQISEINKTENPSSSDKKTMDGLILQVQMIRKSLRTIKEAVWEIEESVIPQALKIPNEIDNDTPEKDSIILKVIRKKPDVSENKKQNHIEIGKNLGLLDYINPVHCFLSNEAVFFELGVLALAGKILNDSKALRVAAPDFCKSLVVEGCGLDHENSAESFILQSADDVDKDNVINRLHLVGGASLPALITMYIKQTLNHKYFPIKVFSSGRQYSPFPSTGVDYGLFSLSQASVVHALTLVKNKNCDEYKSEFQNLISVASKIYDELGCHYRIVLKPARNLHMSESIKVSFEMWSAYANKYVEVGHISGYGDYLSKRLLIGSIGSKKTDYSATVAGTLISVPRVLGCLLEENPDKFILPKKIATHLSTL